MARVQANQVFISVSQTASEKTKNDRKRIATESAKIIGGGVSTHEQTTHVRQKRKHMPTSMIAHERLKLLKMCHEKFLAELKKGYYETKVMVTGEETKVIERDCRQQRGSEL